MRIVLGLIIWCTILALLPGNLHALPTTEEFHNLLIGCAAGANISVDADLIGSISTIYDGDKTQGKARISSKSEFLNSIPEKDRLKALELYHKCIERFVSANPSAHQPRSDTNQYFTTKVASVRRHGDSVTVTLVLRNDREKGYVASYVPNSGFASDNEGAFCEVRKTGGIAQSDCQGIFFPESYTAITPHSEQTIIFNFRCDKNSTGSTIDISTTVCLRAASGFPYTTVAVGISRIEID